MRLGRERQSDNVEDMRGRGGGLRLGGSVGIGTVVVALIASYLFGIDPSVILEGTQQVNVEQAPESVGVPPDDEKALFVSRVLATTEDTWSQVFSEQGAQYPPPKLVLFSGSLPTACGMGVSAAGPFYCPQDRKVYIDLQFYQLMRDRFRAAGDFAQAYVIAHEVGHHIQNVLGILDRMQQARGRVSQREYNAMSVRVELQADCLAGVWARRTEDSKRILEPGDVEEGMNAAAAIGDDALQRQTQGRAVPDSFTHGTSAQRQRWLKRGIDTGDLNACDTFSTGAL
jgi:hypothetical protein